MSRMYVMVTEHATKLHYRTVYPLTQDTTYSKVSFDCINIINNGQKNIKAAHCLMKTGILIVIHTEMSVHRTYQVKLFVVKGRYVQIVQMWGLSHSLCKKYLF